MGLPDDEGAGDERPLVEGDQRPLELDPIAYVELGGVSVVTGPDGDPMIAGAEPRAPGIGLFDDTFICNSVLGSRSPTGQVSEPRPKCEHLAQLVMDAMGGNRGLAEADRPKRIRRFCRALAAQSELMDLTDANVYACDLREPAAEGSTAVIEDFEAQQRKIAIEAKTRSKIFEV